MKRNLCGDNSFLSYLGGRTMKLVQLRHVAFGLALAGAALCFSDSAQAVIWDAGGGAASTAWYTDTNWNPDTTSGSWLTTDTAQFDNSGTATVAGINMATASLSIGAIELTSARTRALTVGNSSTTAGTLTLNGATVNSVANTIIRNASGNGGAGSTLTITNNATGTGKTMDLVIPNLNSVIAVDSVSSGTIVIGSNISGAGGLKVVRIAGGTGQVQLNGTNTYNGDTIIDSARLRAQNGNGIPNGPGKGNVILQGTILPYIPGSQVGSPWLGITASETINGLSGNGFIDNDSGSVDVTLTVGDNDQTSTFDGEIFNTGSRTMSIAKIGNGTLTLTGNNSYTGNTAVTGGTLKMGNANALGHGWLSIVSYGATVTGTTATTGTVDLNGQASVNEIFTLNGTGYLSNGDLVNNSGTAASVGDGVSLLTLTASGSGISAGATVNLTGGGGTGAAATAGLGLTNLSATISAGTGYVNGNTITFTGGGISSMQPQRLRLPQGRSLVLPLRIRVWATRPHRQDLPPPLEPVLLLRGLQISLPLLGCC